MFLCAFNLSVHAQWVIEDDTTWKAFPQNPPAGWFQPGFNTATWGNAIAPPQLPPTSIAGVQTPGMWLDSNQFYAHFVKTFELNCLPNSATITTATDDSYVLYLNGDTVGMDTLGPLVTYNVMSFLNVGINTIAIQALNWFPGAAAVYFQMHIDTTENKLPAQFPNDTIICQGEAITITLNGFDNYNWYDSTTSNTQILSTPGTYWVEVDTNNCFFSDTVVIGNFPNQTLFLGTDTGICSTDSLVLQASGYGSYAWSTAANGNSIVVNSAGTYSLQTTDTNGCSYADTINIAVFSLPTLNIPDSIFQCEGSQSSVSAPAGLSQYQWSTSDTVQSVFLTVNGLYGVTITDSNSCQNLKTFYFQLDSLPRLSLVDSISLCAGDSVLLNAAHPLNQNYLWSTAATTPSIVGYSDSIYSVTVSNACGSLSAQTVISSSIQRSLGLRSDTSLCLGDSILLSVDATAFDSIAWSTGSSLNQVYVQAPNVVVVSGFSACVNASDTIFIGLNPQPVLLLPADTILCNADSLLLSPISFVGDGILWNTLDTTNQIVIRNDAFIVAAATNSCGAASDTINVLFRETPVVQVRDTAVCSGDVAMLDAFFPNSNYIWSTGDTTSSISISPTQLTTVIVTVTNPCGQAIDAATVNMIPAPNINLPANDIICNNQGYFININVPFAQSYAWSTGQSSPFITVQNPGTYSVTVTNACGVDQASITLLQRFSPVLNLGSDTTICSTIPFEQNFAQAGASMFWNGSPSNGIETVIDPGTYTAQVQNQCGSATDSRTFRVIGEPLITFPTDTVICENTPAILSADIAEDATFLWSNGSSDPGILVNRPGIYTLFVSNICGTATDAIRVEVKAPPVISLGNDTVICGTNDLELKVPFNSLWQYRWNVDSAAGNSITITDSGIYSITVLDDCGVEVYDEILVQYNRNKGPFVPDAFTPNNDFVNDTFRVVFSYPVDYSLGIYNRWGQELFSAQSPNAFWDGTFNGKLLEQGIYNVRVIYPNCFGKQESYYSKLMLIR